MLKSLISKTLSPAARASKRVITKFSEEAGLVYFGYVSQRDDEHHIVRGLTVSTKHRDDHYCIGTYNGYDVMFVERTDKLRSGQDHVWHILEIDFKSTADIPHIFISSKSRAVGFHELVEAKFHTMLPHAFGAVNAYPSAFTSQYTVYTTPANAISVERLLTPADTELITKHFKGLIIEVTAEALYVYSEKPHASEQLLMTMLTNGVWLAEQIDKNSRQFDN